MRDQPAHLGDDILNAWIDGVATDEERAIVDDHVATCETCAGRLDDLRLVKAMLGDLPEVTPPRSFRLTPDQAKKPTPIRPRGNDANVIRLLPIVRTLSVAAMIAVLVMGGVLALRDNGATIGDSGDTISLSAMPTGETGDAPGSLEDENPAPAAQQPGEVVDQGESASAHGSTSRAISGQAQDGVATSGGSGLTTLEVATIAVGITAILLGLAWMGLSMSIRNGGSH